MACLLWPLLGHTDSPRIGMVNSIVDNNPANWGYGCVFLPRIPFLYSQIFGLIYSVHIQITSMTGLRTVCLCLL